jgi:hypothetical protein
VTPYGGALEAIDRILNRSGDADEVLRAVVAVLRERAGFDWAGIAFVESGELRLGPESGERKEDVASYTVAFRGDPVAELQISPSPQEAEGRKFGQRVALLISPHCVVGWDTGGLPWDEVR